MKKTISSLDELSAFAKETLDAIVGQRKDGQQATIVALIGDLGSGKTAFTKLLAAHLGVTDIVTSPTFVIEKIYQTQNPIFAKLIHIDAYRLEKREDLEQIGWGEIVQDPKTLIVVEWPSRVEGLIPKDSVKIHFSFINETVREIETEIF